jgi:DNA-binding SARP family transcriptional activator
MTNLDIHLLGEFQVTYGGEPVTTLNTQRLQSLLAYLLLFRRTAVSRQQLAFLLWADSPEAQARTNLRNLLHTLTKALPDADTFLAINGSTLQWRTDAPYTLDVQEFEHAAQSGDSIASLENAVTLYRGELLPGLYDDWLLAERERLDREFTATLDKLIDRLQAQHAYAQALVHAQRLARHDPLREDTYRRLMLLHALNGDRAGVVRIYNQCKLVLKRELDVEPSRETDQVYQRALRLEPPPTPNASAHTFPSASMLAFSSPVIVPLTPPAPRVWYLQPSFLRNAAYGVSILLPVLLLSMLVFALEMPLWWALPISLLAFVGLFLLLDWESKKEIMRLDLRDEIQQKLYACRRHVREIFSLAPRIQKAEVRQRVEQICVQTDALCARLEQTPHVTLATAARFEFILSETRDILFRYIEITQGRVTASRETLDTTTRKIQDDLIPQLAASLNEFAAALDRGELLKLETAIQVLENTLKTEGLA